MSINLSSRQLAQYIDHTLLKANATRDDIQKLCEEAKNWSFKAVCINPRHVSYAKKLLEGTGVAVCTVIGFPLGANTTKIKVLETEEAINSGADEIDMVIAVGSMLEEDYQYVEQDITAVVASAHKYLKTVKVIIETAELNQAQIVKVCQIALLAGADYVKTSTGFSTLGATVENVKLMSLTVKNKAKVKASGGVKNLEDALAMIEAGAERIGTSSGVQICQQLV